MFYNTKKLMSIYPKHLLPQPNYQYIKQKDLLSQQGLVLMRYIEGENVKWIDGTHKLHPDCLMFPNKHLKDLSCNLLGVFQKSDIFYRIDKKCKDKFYASWEEFTEVLCPSDEECYYDKESKWYFIPINKLMDTNIPFDVSGEIYHFTIYHTPMRCNFWHVSIRVLNSKDEEVSTLDLKDNQRRNIWRAARTILLEQIEYICDAFVTVPQECYVVTPSLL